MITYIYTVSDKNGVVYYVGRTENPEGRSCGHRKCNNFEIIDTIETDYEYYRITDLENYWIDQMRQWGFVLKNKNGNLAYDRRNIK